MTLTQMMAVLLGRWKLIVGCTLGFSLIALIASLMVAKEYTASAAVLVDTRGADPLSQSPSERTQAANQAVMATQVDLIGSERVARQVVRRLKLYEVEAYRERWRRKTNSEGDAVSFIAQELLGELSVKPSRDSNVINLKFTASEPALASRIVNEFARSTISTNLELKIEPARQYAEWFDVRIKSLRAALESAQERLTEYQREAKLTPGGTGNQIDIENAKLAQLTSQLIDIQAIRAESNSRQAQAQGSAPTSPDVQSNAVVAALRGSIATAEATLEQMRTQLGDRHPQVESAKQQLAALNQRLAAETQRVAKMITSSDIVNRQREAETRVALEAQRTRVLQLLKGTNEIAVLQRDVDNARQALEMAMTKQSQSSLESEVQQTNVYVLTEGVPPGRASSPRVLLNSVTALAMGLLFGLALATWLENQHPIVRSEDDLRVAMELPIMLILNDDASSRPRSSLPSIPAIRQRLS